MRATAAHEAVDRHGNQTQQNVYNTDPLPADARVYNYTYLATAVYTSRYIRNYWRPAISLIDSTC